MNEQQLLNELKSMKRSREPQRDLWPDIEQELVDPPSQSTRWPWAAAAAVLASVLTVFGLSTRESLAPHDPWPMVDNGSATGSLIAAGLDREYSGALRDMAGELRAWTKPEVEVGGLEQSLAVLQTATEDLRAALERDPDAVYLAELLESTHRKRLQVLKELMMHRYAESAYVPTDMEDMT